MALRATRTETQTLSAFPEPQQLCQGLGAVTIESEYWDHPSKLYSLLLKQTKTSTNQYGQVLHRDIEEWTYEGIIQGEGQAPTRHHREIWALIWLPDVTHRQNLIKCEEHWTTYWLASAWASGPLCRRTVKAGYVIYDQMPTYLSEADYADFCATQGRRPPNEPMRLIPDSARSWSSAIGQAAIVEEPGHPQTTIWLNPWEIEEIIVNDDHLRTVTFTIRKDYTVPGPPDVTREETAKDPLVLTLPIDPDAPTLSGTETTDGVLLEIRGGGSMLHHVWPVETTVPVPVTGYALYRLIVTPPTYTASGDPFGIWKTPPAAPTDITLTIETTACKDFAGAPASELPTQTAYSESEDNSPTTPTTWEHLADLENDETDKMLPGRATYVDSDVETGGTYEYYAVALIGDAVSPESAHVIVSPGSYSSTSALRVRVTTPKKRPGVETSDEPITIDVLDPYDQQFGVDSPLYGETAVFEIPARFDNEGQGTGIDGDPGWPADTLTTAEDLGRAVALRQFLADSERFELAITPAMPLLFLERGQLLTIPAVSWETWGNALHLSSRVVASTWSVEGWSIGISRNGDSWAVQLGDIVAEEL